MNRSLEAVYVTDLQICGNAPNNVLITSAIIDLSIRMTISLTFLFKVYRITLSRRTRSPRRSGPSAT